MSNIPVFKPFLGEEENAASVTALNLGWLGPGSYVREFEAELAAFFGVEDWQVVAVNTGCSAVHLGLELCGVGPGDEVITPSFNNISDFQMIKALGAEPVFCDVLGETLTIDPYAIEPLITDKTKAIVFLDYGSALCDYDAVVEVAHKHGLKFVYDAAHGFGSSRDGKKIGSAAPISTFSFDPVKNITCIDGGAVVVQSKDDAERIRYMRLLGQRQDQDKLARNERGWTYDVHEQGYRYHLANLHGAIGVEQMKKMDVIYAQRNRVFKRYAQALTGTPGLVQPVCNGDDMMPFMYVVRVLDGQREAFREYLASKGVDTGVHWRPGHEFEAFKNCRNGDLSVTKMISDQVVTLPLYPELKDEEVDYIVSVIKDFALERAA